MMQYDLRQRVIALVTVFLVHAQRGTAAARVLLGECLQAILVSDRWSAYAFWATEQRQLCWAHLLREFQAFTERGGAAARVGRALLRETKPMFAWWAQVRDGTRTHRQFWQDMRPVRHRVEAQLRRGVAQADAKTAATCRDLLGRAPALWTFVDLPDVEPTNNIAMWSTTSPRPVSRLCTASPPLPCSPHCPRPERLPPPIPRAPRLAHPGRRPRCLDGAVPPPPRVRSSSPVRSCWATSATPVTWPTWVAFLCSPKARYITGERINVDRGLRRAY